MCLSDVCCCLLGGLTHWSIHSLGTVVIFTVIDVIFPCSLKKTKPNQGKSLHPFLLFQRTQSLIWLLRDVILPEATEDFFRSWSKEAFNRQKMPKLHTFLLSISMANWPGREALILTPQTIWLSGVGRGMKSEQWKKSGVCSLGRYSREKQLWRKSKGNKCGEKNEEEIKNIHTSQKLKRWWYPTWMKTQQDCWGKEPLNSLRAYAARIRPNSSLGVTGLTNPNHTLSPRDPGLPALPLYTLNLLNLTRFPLISHHLTLSPR